MKRYILTETSFIAGSLLAAGSIVTEAELNGAEPGTALVEVDAKGRPLDKGVEIPVAAGITEFAPVAPHAANPTHPQGLPGHTTGEFVDPARFAPAEGDESDADAKAREAQAKAKK